MKAGDIIGRDINYEAGHVLICGFETTELAENWKKHNNATAEVKPDDANEGYFMCVATSPYIEEIQAKVNWEVDGEMGISYLSPPDWKGTSSIATVSEWRVIQEAPKSYKDELASMSDKELRGAVDDLRSMRVNKPQLSRRTIRKTSPPVANDPIAKLLAKLPPDKKEALMIKLGLK